LSIYYWKYWYNHNFFSSIYHLFISL